MRNLTFVLLAALIVGCAHGGTLVQPGSQVTDGIKAPTGSAQSSGKVLWGLYEVTLDPVTETAEIVPLRGAEFKASVTRFVQPPQGKSYYVTFGGLDFTDFATEGIVRLDVGLTHPFPGLDQYRGFDVMGVFMSDATFTSQVDSGAVLPRTDGSDARLLNADGYTRWNNPSEFPSPTLFGYTPGIFGTPNFTPYCHINGYKYFCDGLNPGDEIQGFFDNEVNLENRGSFAAGSMNSRDYEIVFPDPGSPLKYQYAILASWEQPSNIINPTVEDFAPVANQAEPWLMVADTTGSSVFYEDADNNGGVVHVDLAVYDWQAYLNHNQVADEIGTIYVESFTGGFVEFAPVDIIPVAGDPHGDAASVYSVDIVDVSPTQSGEEFLLITVQNTEPDTYEQGFSVPVSDGILSSYIVTSVMVSAENPANQAPSVGAISGEEAPMEVDIEDYTVAALDPEGDTLH